MSRLTKIVVPLSMLCLITLSGTNAGSTTARRTSLVVTGLIPEQMLASLSSVAGLPVNTVPYEGSLGIIEDLREGKVEFGAATSDAAYLAFTGQLGRRMPPFGAVRGIIVLDLKTIHFMLSSGSRAASIGDLKGARVSLGPPRGGTPLVSELLLEKHGLTLDDIDERYLQAAEAEKALSAGTLDAAFMPLVAPGAQAASAARSGARLLDIEGPAVEQLRLEYPFLLRTRLPPGTYPGQATLVKTLAVDLLLVCRADADEDFVYALLRTYFGELAKSTIATDLSRASAMSVPLHPGAARYYRERELSR
jgi:TRAP transporter TAXI family solute receptor